MFKKIVCLCVLSCILTMTFSQLSASSDYESLKNQLKDSGQIKKLSCPAENQVIIIKNSDKSPACFFKESISKITQRGWGTFYDQDIYFGGGRTLVSADQILPLLWEQKLKQENISYKVNIDKNFETQTSLPVAPWKACSPILESDGNEFYVYTVIEKNPGKFSEIMIEEGQLNDCDKIFLLGSKSNNESQSAISTSNQDSATRIEISFDKPTTSNLLPVIFTEITTNAENLTKIIVWNFGLIGHNADDRQKVWDFLPQEQRAFYKITDESGQDIIDKTRMSDNLEIPSDQRTYQMDCDLPNHVEGKSAHPTAFPIRLGTSTIMAKNSYEGIFPNTNEEYSFEFASLLETNVKLPDHAKIISQESKQCKLTQNVEIDNEIKYTDGYYTRMVFKLE